MQRRLMLVALVGIACRGGEAVPRENANPGTDLGHEVRATGDSNPFAAHALPPDQQGWLDGWVEERLVAGSYVYLRVRTTAPAGVTWVASLAMTTPDRPHVRVLVLGRAEQFHSRRLQRDFEPLLFGAVRAASPDLATLSKGT